MGVKALITGVTGFVGRYLADHLNAEGCTVWGTTRHIAGKEHAFSNVTLIESDLSDEPHIVGWLNKIRPDHIYHLAGQSNVKRSWEHKAETFEANVTSTIHLLEAIRKSDVADSARVLTVGSSEEYGRVSPEEMPITEDTPLRPISPYGISKATVSMLARHYYEAYGMQIIHARPFNHIGPGQGLGFVTQDFAKQIAEIEKGLREPVIRVGNLEAARDFTDVRDIVRAYELLLKKGTAGQFYNVCSSNECRIGTVLDTLIKLSSIPIERQIDPGKFRTVDQPTYIGSHDKMMKELRWQPIIPLTRSLHEILSYYRS